LSSATAGLRRYLPLVTSCVVRRGGCTMAAWLWLAIWFQAFSGLKMLRAHV